MIGLFFAFYRGARSTNGFNHDTYVEVRQIVGKSILLGLEVLIAADIMATVVTEPTLRSILVLGFIVLIRTFLSLSSRGFIFKALTPLITGFGRIFL